LNDAYKKHLQPVGYLRYEAPQNNKKGGIKEDVKEIVLGNIKEQEQETEKEEQMSSSEIEDILILLTPTSKDDCMWEFEEGGSKKKYNMLDKEFFAKYKAKEIKLAGREKMRLKIRIDNYNKGKGSMRKEYSILKVEEIIEEKDLFNQ
jgi:predicted metalloprotease